jgi:hypothetical protein
LGAGAGPIRFSGAGVENMLEKIEVLLHGVQFTQKAIFFA